MRTGYERLTGQRPDPYGRPTPSTSGGLAATSPTRAVFYAHGTADDNLRYDGESGCWERGTCTLPEDPLYSMDPGGALEDRDDISTVTWLTRRHGLPSQPSAQFVMLGGAPCDETENDDVCVTTRRYDYEHVPDPEATFVRVHGEAVRWYEMNGAGHGIAALDRAETSDLARDHDASVHTQRFFESRAGMLVAR